MISFLVRVQIIRAHKEKTGSTYFALGEKGVSLIKFICLRYHPSDPLRVQCAVAQDSLRTCGYEESDHIQNSL